MLDFKHRSFMLQAKRLFVLNWLSIDFRKQKIAGDYSKFDWINPLC